MRVAEYSRSCLQQLRADTGIAYEQRTGGTLQLFRTEKQLADVHKDVDVLKAAGVPCEVLDRAGCIAAEPGLADGHAVGLLGMDPMTRRRNRLNGTVRRKTGVDGAGAFDISVVQSFGNCPRYIQNRSVRFVRPADGPTQVPAVELASLDQRAQVLIAQADTFYVASYVEGGDGSRQVDVSHRGGKPGFVRIDADGTLTIPDFSGNLFFMTLGNFLVNPKAGLLFIDSETGEMLQMTGEASVILDSPEIAAFEGAERLWTFKPRRIVRRPDALPLRWSMAADGWSPHLQMTGSWADASQRLAAARLGRQWRPFRVAQAVDESSTIRSLYLEPADGMTTVASLAGQHLPLRLTLADGSHLQRTSRGDAGAVRCASGGRIDA
jgi:predicted pyridoxine 5'-phosphate oxidase superfamily flavin-nucleotide-binding protein